jgi:hypothetical protein
MNEEKKGKREKRVYDEAFRREAVALLQSSDEPHGLSRDIDSSTTATRAINTPAAAIGSCCIKNRSIKA